METFSFEIVNGKLIEALPQALRKGILATIEEIAQGRVDGSLPYDTSLTSCEGMIYHPEKGVKFIHDSTMFLKGYVGSIGTGLYSPMQFPANLADFDNVEGSHLDLQTLAKSYSHDSKGYDRVEAFENEVWKFFLPNDALRMHYVRETSDNWDEFRRSFSFHRQCMKIDVGFSSTTPYFGLVTLDMGIERTGLSTSRYSDYGVNLVTKLCRSIDPNARTVTLQQATDVGAKYLSSEDLEYFKIELEKSSK